MPRDIHGRCAFAMTLLLALGGLRAAPALSTLFLASFDGGTTEGFPGKVETEIRLGRAGGSLELLITPTYYWHRSSHLPWRDMGRMGPQTFVSFAYYTTDNVDLHLYLYAEVGGKTKLFKWVLGETVPQAWTWVLLHCGRPHPRLGVPSLGVPKGATFRMVSFHTGSGQKSKKPPYHYRFYVDHFRLTKGLPREVTSAIARQKKSLARYTFTLARDRLRLNRAMLLDLGKRIGGKRARARTILVAGDSPAANEAFVGGLQKWPRGLPEQTGYRIVRDAGCLGRGLRSDDLAARLPAVLAKVRPELVAVIVGLDEARWLIQQRERAEEVAGTAEAEAGPSAGEVRKRAGELRRRYAKDLGAIVAAALEAGAVPVLFTLPPAGRYRKGHFLPAAELLALAGIVTDLGRKRSVPVIDVLAELMPRKGKTRPAPFRRPSPKRSPKPRHGMSAADTQSVNRLFLKLYRGLEAELFKTSRQAQ